MNLRTNIDPNFFPLDEVPFQTLVLVTTPTGLKTYCQKFIPSTLEIDLAIGGGNRLLYWYPEYSKILYQYATDGKHYDTYLSKGHPSNVHIFSTLFPSTKKNLDSILNGKLKTNILSETIRKN